MLAHAWNPWFAAPILLALALSVVSIIAAYVYNKGGCPKNINQTYFEGPAKRHLASLGIGVPLAPILLSDEVRADMPSMGLLSASTLLLLAASLVGLWLYSVVQALPKPEEGAVTIASPRPVAVQGVILSLMATAIMAIIVFALVTPVFAAGGMPNAAGATTIHQEYQYGAE